MNKRDCYTYKIRVGSKDTADCNHYACLRDQGFFSWRKDRNNFQIGDIVYLFSSKERKIIFKTIVVGEEPRQDCDYWNEIALEDLTWRLEALKEYTGNLLDEGPPDW